MLRKHKNNYDINYNDSFLSNTQGNKPNNHNCSVRIENCILINSVVGDFSTFSKGFKKSPRGSLVCESVNKNVVTKKEALRKNLRQKVKNQKIIKETLGLIAKKNLKYLTSKTRMSGENDNNLLRSESGDTQDLKSNSGRQSKLSDLFKKSLVKHKKNKPAMICNIINESAQELPLIISTKQIDKSIQLFNNRKLLKPIVISKTRKNAHLSKSVLRNTIMNNKTGKHSLLGTTICKKAEEHKNSVISNNVSITDLLNEMDILSANNKQSPKKVTNFKNSFLAYKKRLSVGIGGNKNYAKKTFANNNLNNKSFDEIIQRRGEFNATKLTNEIYEKMRIKRCEQIRLVPNLNTEKKLKFAIPKLKLINPFEIEI